MDYNQNNNQYQSFNQQQNFNQYPNFNQASQGQFNPYVYQNNPQAYYISQQKFLKLREQKNEIRRFAKIFALAMLGFLVASMLFSAILEAFGLIDLYYSNGTFSSGVGIFYSLLTVGVPFFIAKKIVYKTPDLPVCSYSAPKANLKTASIILAVQTYCRRH
jgi:hypothetical protein